jgi:hypothetical protein
MDLEGNGRGLIEALPGMCLKRLDETAEKYKSG